MLSIMCISKQLYFLHDLSSHNLIFHRKKHKIWQTSDVVTVKWSYFYTIKKSMPNRAFITLGVNLIPFISISYGTKVVLPKQYFYVYVLQTFAFLSTTLFLNNKPKLLEQLLLIVHISNKGICACLRNWVPSKLNWIS